VCLVEVILTSALCSSDIIYYFKVDIRESNIPNAGLGAFLTFLGARELDAEDKARGESRLIGREQEWKQRLTTTPLLADHPDGYRLSLTLEGSNLHGHFNSPYLLKSLEAVLPDGREAKVRLANHEKLYYEDELDAFKSTKDDERIGFLGLFKEADYFPAPKRTFSSLLKNCGVIDLGRYGPFKRQGTRIQRSWFVVARCT
jgi:hypothetical protein